ncbi:Lrp/AsnC family transcriptional regulator [Mesorhizobium waimense]|uniref:Lrp/AsnC family transcriptional regulator n=2 Tax=Mesorhizobium waimense TaxID=1300307 RepID=A0A3A5KXM3_9HYPH|nr:Lrp/AsnC family transcriptional regulator [Mesorhizobium waimense]
MAAPVALDSVDRGILKVLQLESRIAYSDLAKQVGLSTSPCHRRVQLLENAGVIERYAALLDPEKVDLGLTVFVRVWLENQSAAMVDRFANDIQGFPQVVECHLMAGDADFLVRVVVADLKAYRKFQTEDLARMAGVLRVKADIPLQEIKRTWELPV